MSRVGRKIIDIAEGVDVQLVDYTVKVTKGNNTLEQEIHPDIKVEIDKTNKTIELKRPTNNKVHRSLHGLYRALINNMVIGVTSGFERKLEIIGVGYKAELRGKVLVLNLGYSHPIVFKPPEEIELSLDNPTNIKIKGINKQLVGQIAAKIRSFRPPEPYKGKGIRYAGEYVRRKAGKAAA